MRVRAATMAVLALIATALSLRLRADERTQKMIDGLEREAAAFEKGAPQVAAEETQRERVLKPPPKFRPRFGKAAKTAPPPEWIDKAVVSEYAYVLIGGAPHEIRQVISVDGTRVRPDKQAEDRLAEALADGDVGRLNALRQLEKYGLKGGVTDAALLLMMFKPGYVEHYEFTGIGPRMADTTQTFVFRYKQLDGTGGLTVFDGGGAPRRLKVEGEIWSRVSDWAPLRIILTASDGEGADQLREETSVQYEKGALGFLLPTLVRHRELRGGIVAAEQTFSYSEFHRIDSNR